METWKKMYIRDNLPSMKTNLIQDMFANLIKALYGLKQAPRAWFAKLSKKLYDLRFKGSKADTSLFYCNRNGISMFIPMYVDDIIVASSK
jgi:hypothetical protein